MISQISNKILPVIPKLNVKNQKTNCHDNTKDSYDTHDSIQNWRYGHQLSDDLCTIGRRTAALETRKEKKYYHEDKLHSRRRRSQTNANLTRISFVEPEYDKLLRVRNLVRIVGLTKSLYTLPCQTKSFTLSTLSFWSRYNATVISSASEIIK